MNDFMDVVRGHIVGSDDEAAVSNWTNLLTCGYICGGNNADIIAKDYVRIIDNVEKFYAGMSEAEKRALPNGVNTRLESAYKEAKEYAEEHGDGNGALFKAACAQCKSRNCGDCRDVAMANG